MKMDITLKDIGRRFGRDWIFRGVNLHIPAGSHTIITGPNGSGKSTLLMVLTGFMEASEGSIIRSEKGVALEVADAALKTSITTP
jgi:ABC-type Mn2+/Zn2+ transport system ATPase subunit